MAKEKKSPSGDGSVGYGKPPVAHRFKPGVSGNPGGRKKGSTNVRTDFEEMLGRILELNENGKKTTITFRQAIIASLMKEGVRGNIRAIELCLDRAERYESVTARQEENVTEDDAAIIERRMNRRAVAAQPSKRSLAQKHHAETETGEGDDDV